MLEYNNKIETKKMENKNYGKLITKNWGLCTLLSLAVVLSAYLAAGIFARYAFNLGMTEAMVGSGHEGSERFWAAADNFVWVGRIAIALAVFCAIMYIIKYFKRKMIEMKEKK